MLRKKLLLMGILVGAQFSLPALSQEAETQSDLDVTLTVVDESENVEDLLNNIELPPEAREIAEETMEAVKAVVTAARNGDIKSEEEAEALVQEAMARSQELMANASLSADAANEEALRAAEATREAVEEAVKNALAGADVEGLIEQMMRDILENLPDGVRSQLPADLDTLFDEARNNLPQDPES